ncbi:unnamed protein product [Microthlaspi erraticum]|uniref:Uncharacterized protein n=1 Tax=Microthlaspi erraticum TaxID=1685480 RepID=A0A6D2IWD7_9BRAS|nr:unnamed protein product [Microthlaspi erraticum]
MFLGFHELQNKRGGRVKLQSIVVMPLTEFEHVDKGDALYGMELALSLNSTYLLRIFLFFGLGFGFSLNSEDEAA